MDSFVYCVAGIGTSCATDSGGSKPKAVVIRLGSEQQDASDASFEYVAVLPCAAVQPPSNPYWSGSFDASGAYHIIGGVDQGSTRVYVLDGDKRPDSLQGFAQHDTTGIADFTSIQPLCSPLSLCDYSLAPYDLATKVVGNVSYGFFISSGGQHGPTG